MIGILSDTHDNTAMTAAAVQLLKERGAEYFLHCGNVGSCLVLDYLWQACHPRLCGATAITTAWNCSNMRKSCRSPVMEVLAI
ncbi:MAG: metallophosphoesterase family protein [Bacillota bacterium]